MARVSRAEIDVIINNEKADKAIRDLALQCRDFGEALAAATKRGDTDAMKMISQELNRARGELAPLIKKVVDVENVLKNLNKVSLRDLDGAQRKLRGQLQGLSRDSDEYKKKTLQLKKVTEELAASAGRSASKVQNVWDRFKNAIFTFDIVNLTQKVIGQVDKAIDAYARYDDKLADVMKTTGLSKDVTEQLSESLSTVDTRSSQNELLGLAQQAGKLGLSAEKDVEKFVLAADKIGVALGEDLGDKEQAINSIGKLSDLFKLKDEYGMGDAMLKIGSAVNALGAASTANEGYIVDFTSRTGGIAVSAKIAAADIMALGATFDSLNQPAEASATIINKVIVGMFAKTSEYAKVAKMDVKEFSELLRTDANEALLKVLDGMQGADLGQISNMLGDLGQDGARAAQAMVTISSSVDIVRTQQALANEEFAKGTSILEEFSTKNDTAQARREKQQKEAKKSLVALGEKLQPIVEMFYFGSITATKALHGLLGVLYDYKGTIVAVAAVTGTYVAVQKLSASWSKIRTFWTASNTLAIHKEVFAMLTHTQAIKAGTITNATYTLGQKAMAFGASLLTGSFRTVTIAARAFFASIGPVGWAITAVTALVSVVGAMRLFGDTADSTSDAYAQLAMDVDKEKSTYEDLKKRLHETTEGTLERAQVIKLINERYGDGYLSGLLTEKSRTEDIAAALDLATQRMRDNFAEKVKAAELEKAQQAQYDAQKQALKELLDLYNRNGDKTEEQLQNMANQFAPLIRNITTASDKAKFLREMMKITGTDSAMSAAVIQRYIRTTSGVFENLTTAAGEFSGQLRTINALTGTTQQGLVKYYEQKLAAMDKNSPNRKITQSLLDKARKDAGMGASSSSSITTPCTKCGKNPCECHQADTKKQQAWALDNDTEFSAKRVALKRRQLSGELATEEEYNKEVLALEVATLEARISTNKDKGAELEKIKEQLLDKQIERSKQAAKRDEMLTKTIQGGDNELKKAEREHDDKLRELGMFNKKVEDMTAQEKEALLVIERTYQSKVGSIKVAAIEKQLAAEQKKITTMVTGLRLTQAQGLSEVDTFEKKKELLRSKFGAKHLENVRTDKDADKMLKAKYMEQEQAQTKEGLTKILDIYEKMATGVVLSGLLSGTANATAEECAQIEEIITKLNQDIAKLGQNPTDTADAPKRKQVDVLGMTPDDWKQTFANLKEGKGGLEEYAAAVGAIGQAVGQAFGDISNLMVSIEQRELKSYEKTQNKKKQTLERQLKSGAISQEGYNAKVQLLDNQTEAKRVEMERKQAERQKMMAIFSAMINTAVAVVGALGSQPFGPWNIALAAIVGALGAVQVAAIAAQPLPGAEAGGMLVEREQDGKRFNAEFEPRKRGAVSKPTVIVGENGTEYVVPAEGYQNNSVRPVLDILERARRSGTLGSINLPAIMQAQMVQGRATGGQVFATPQLPPSPHRSSPDDSQTQELLQATVAVITKLNERLEHPIRADVSMTGDKGVAKNYEKYQRLKDRANA